MGLFGKPKMQFSKEEAVLYLLFCSMEADGEVSEDEIAELGKQLIRIKLLKNVDADAAFKKYSKLYDSDPDNYKKIIDTAVPLIPQENRLAVFSYCLQAMLSDGDFSDSEQTYALYLSAAFGLNGDEGAHTITLMGKRYIL